MLYFLLAGIDFNRCLMTDSKWQRRLPLHAGMQSPPWNCWEKKKQRKPPRKKNEVSIQLSAWTTVNTSRWRWPDTWAARVCMHVHLLSVFSPCHHDTYLPLLLQVALFSDEITLLPLEQQRLHSPCCCDGREGKRGRQKESGPCLKVPFPWKWWQTVQGEERFNKVAECLHCSVPRGHHTHTHTHTHTAITQSVINYCEGWLFFFHLWCVQSLLLLRSSSFGDFYPTNKHIYLGDESGLLVHCNLALCPLPPPPCHSQGRCFGWVPLMFNVLPCSLYPVAAGSCRRREEVSWTVVVCCCWFFFVRTSNEVQPRGGFAEVSAWYCGQKHPPVWWTVLYRTGPLTPLPLLQHLAEDGRVRTERATLLGEQLRVSPRSLTRGQLPHHPPQHPDLHLQTSVIDIFSRDA